ncbi:hypothetical protein BVRB_4g090630 [Beta vulgaris subsp. vulgaris]|nr:hypothetical protein BVRB_4g090630 [Beta vulgaris subsp. vulgaris]
MLTQGFHALNQLPNVVSKVTIHQLIHFKSCLVRAILSFKAAFSRLANYAVATIGRKNVDS